MKNFRKISLGLLLSAQVLTTFYACSSDSSVEQENKLYLGNNLEQKSKNNWEQYVTQSEYVTKDNAIVFSTRKEYIDFIEKLNEEINRSELNGRLMLENKKLRGVSVRGGCSDGVYYGLGMTSGFATLGFDVSVSGGCITGVSGSFSGMTLGISYSQGGTNIGCKSASVCGNINYNLFVEGVGTVYSRKVCYSINLNC